MIVQAAWIVLRNAVILASTPSPSPSPCAACSPRIKSNRGCPGTTGKRRPNTDGAKPGRALARKTRRPEKTQGQWHRQHRHQKKKKNNNNNNNNKGSIRTGIKLSVGRNGMRQRPREEEEEGER